MWKPNTKGQKRLLEALAAQSPSGIEVAEFIKLAREQCRLYLFERDLVELVGDHVVLTVEGEEAWSTGHHWDRFA
ncbi:MAG: hypothetical protein KAI25_09720 [Hyphomicrobiaceae bacterium]|nr:hypothetical protein [Hyphomicrobiaceae bacterium]